MTHPSPHAEAREVLLHVWSRIRSHTMQIHSVLCVRSGITMVTYPVFCVRSLLLALTLYLFIYLLAFFCVLGKTDPKPTV